jgi:gas vesicle GvpC-like protein
MPTGVYVRRKLKRRKRRPKLYRTTLTRTTQHTVGFCVRASRALRHAARAGRVLRSYTQLDCATLITNQFLAVLEQNNPAQAAQLREELNSDKHSKNIINLDV